MHQEVAVRSGELEHGGELSNYQRDLQALYVQYPLSLCMILLMSLCPLWQMPPSPILHASDYTSIGSDQSRCRLDQISEWS